MEKGNSILPHPGEGERRGGRTNVTTLCNRKFSILSYKKKKKEQKVAKREGHRDLQNTLLFCISI